MYTPSVCVERVVFMNEEVDIFEVLAFEYKITKMVYVVNK